MIRPPRPVLHTTQTLLARGSVLMGVRRTVRLYRYCTPRGGLRVSAVACGSQKIGKGSPLCANWLGGDWRKPAGAVRSGQSRARAALTPPHALTRGRHSAGALGWRRQNCRVLGTRLPWSGVPGKVPRSTWCSRCRGEGALLVKSLPQWLVNVSSWLAQRESNWASSS